MGFIIKGIHILTRQAKILTGPQIRTLLAFVEKTRHPARNRVICLLSLKAGLRAKEIASVTWSMVTDAEGVLSDCIRLTNQASKGASGGAIPMARELRSALSDLRNLDPSASASNRIIQTCRSDSTSAQAIVNIFRHWYGLLGFEGCSSHSGRRTFITMAARNIGRFGGSIRDVQALARHSSLAMTQRYIEIDAEAMRRVVDA